MEDSFLITNSSKSGKNKSLKFWSWCFIFHRCSYSLLSVHDSLTHSVPFSLYFVRIDCKWFSLKALLLLVFPYLTVLSIKYAAFVTSSPLSPFFMKSINCYNIFICIRSYSYISSFPSCLNWSDLSFL